MSDFQTKSAWQNLDYEYFKNSAAYVDVAG